MGDNPVPDFVAALSFLSLDDSITSASLRIDNSDPYEEDTRVSTVKLPWQNDFDVGSEHGTLFVEAALGWLKAKDRASVPTVLGDVEVAQDWQLLAAKLGAGWTYLLAESWKLRPSLGFALSYTENKADYNELAEQILAPYIDGVFVNFDAWALTSAGSLTLIHEREMGELELLVQGRYTYAWTDVFDATDPFQEQADASEFVSLRFDLEGPTPLEAWERALRWTVFGSFATFLDSNEEALGFDYLFELGLGLRIPLPRLFDDVLLSAAAILGEDIRGSSIGLSIHF